MSLPANYSYSRVAIKRILDLSQSPAKVSGYKFTGCWTRTDAAESDAEIASMNLSGDQNITPVNDGDETQTGVSAAETAWRASIAPGTGLSFDDHAVDVLSLRFASHNKNEVLDTSSLPA